MSDQSNGQVSADQNTHTFNPNDHLIQFRNRDGYKDYLPVQWRLVWFREQCPEGTIQTEEVVVDLDREVEEETYIWNSEKRQSDKVVRHGRGYARFRATVTDGKGGSATGTKSENAASFPDYIEKAETGAIGRALAALGYGSQFAPEMDEAHRIVDSPVDRQSASSQVINNGYGYGSNSESGKNNSSANTTNGNRAPESDAPSTITEQQLASIRKLCEHLGKEVPEDLSTLSFVGGKKVIQQLTAEYRESKQNRAS
jgi:hypothetical protein